MWNWEEREFSLASHAHALLENPYTGVLKKTDFEGKKRLFMCSLERYRQIDTAYTVHSP